MILLIYFLNFRKAHFTKKLISFSKKYRFKSISCFARDFLTLLRTPVRAILFTRQNMTTQLSSSCIAFWGNVYPFTLPEPSGELITREKLISRKKTSEITHLRTYEKAIFRIRIPTQRKEMDRIVIVRTGTYL